MKIILRSWTSREVNNADWVESVCIWLLERIFRARYFPHMVKPVQSEETAPFFHVCMRLNACEINCFYWYQLLCLIASRLLATEDIFYWLLCRYRTCMFLKQRMLRQELKKASFYNLFTTKSNWNIYHFCKIVNIWSNHNPPSLEVQGRFKHPVMEELHVFILSKPSGRENLTGDGTWATLLVLVGQILSQRKKGQDNKFKIGTLEKLFPDYRAFYCT